MTTMVRSLMITLARALELAPNIPLIHPPPPFFLIGPPPLAPRGSIALHSGPGTTAGELQLATAHVPVPSSGSRSSSSLGPMPGLAARTQMGSLPNVLDVIDTVSVASHPQSRPQSARSSLDPPLTATAGSPGRRIDIDVNVPAASGPQPRLFGSTSMPTTMPTSAAPSAPGVHVRRQPGMDSVPMPNVHAGGAGGQAHAHAQTQSASGMTQADALSTLLLHASQHNGQAELRRFGLGPLHAAAIMGDLDAAERLLSQPGLSPAKRTSLLDARDSAGRTALIYAVLSDVQDMCELLLRAGADPNMGDDDGRTPLHWAAFHGRERIFAYLIAAGCSGPANGKHTQLNAIAQDTDGRSVLHWVGGETEKICKS